MPQLFDKTRDYYADLELSHDASKDDVKKRFKKLALVWHPDRNPGREQEVNAKFQTIQAAHEILSDDKVRPLYDEARKNYTGRFQPRASGVRGNPWQDIGRQWQPPPSRSTTNSSSTRPHSGAHRYDSFANSVPRSARSTTREDPQARRSNADAWENMRSNSTRRAPPPTPPRAPPQPPPTPGRAPTSATRDSKASTSASASTTNPVPPPRTAYQQQKAQASFGKSRNGYVPHSPGLADEPPASNSYYFKREHSNLFSGVTPDATDTNPGASTASTSASTATGDPLAQFRAKVWDERQSTPYHTPGGEKTSLFDDDGPGLGRSATTRTPRNHMPGAYPPSGPRSSSLPRNSNRNGESGDATKDATKGSTGSTRRGIPNGSNGDTSEAGDRYKPKPEQNTPTDYFSSVPTNSGKPSVQGGNSVPANDGPSVFTFANGNEAPDKGTSTDGLGRHSADNINTRFVEDELPDDLQFSAGAANGLRTPTKSKPQSRSRVTRRQAMKSKTPQAERAPSAQEGLGSGLGNAAQQGFSAGQWSDQIGSKHFEPQSVRSTSASPTRRPNPKKPKPVKMTAGTAGLVDEEESEGWQEPPRPSSNPGQSNYDSASAMDIDSPPPEKVDSTPKASQTSGARKIPVEPHREEWRAGNVNGVHPQPAGATAHNVNFTQGQGQFAEGIGARPAFIPTAHPFTSQHGGSEDTEEFRTTLSDFTKVEPFTDPTPTGLGGFADLRSTLPFESRPSEQIPLERQPVLPSLPSPPVAPRLPAGTVTNGARPNIPQTKKYADDFYSYMAKWETFNSHITSYFSDRDNQLKARRQTQGPAWFNNSVDDYMMGLSIEQAALEKWLEARKNHQEKLREFKMFKEWVK